MQRFVFFVFGLLLTCKIFAHSSPWITPPWECEASLGYHFYHIDLIQSPTGSFRQVQNTHEFFTSWGMTIWPCIHVQSQLMAFSNNNSTFAFEALFLTSRFVLLNDLSGGWITLTAGVTCGLAGSSALHNLALPYHGHLNLELHGAIGKSFFISRGTSPFRLWAYGGYGIAERGSNWIRGVLACDHMLLPWLEYSLLLHALGGFGTKNLTLDNINHFKGYGSIAHRSLDLGARFQFFFGSFASLNVLGWMNLWATNYPLHGLGIRLALNLPFNP